MKRAALLVSVALLTGCASQKPADESTDAKPEMKSTDTKTATTETPASQVKTAEVPAPKPADVPAPSKTPPTVETTPAPTPTPAPEVKPPDAPKVEAPAAPAPPAAPVAGAALSHENEPKDLYFESQKDGKTYVLGYVSTLMAVQKGAAPAGLDEKASFGPEGETVVFENDVPGLEDRLVKDYQKQHPKK